jgi:hypothetical protein
MRAARRSYTDAVGWIKSARPPGFRSSSWALKALDGTVVVGIVVLGTIGLLSPSSFGNPGATPMGSGWPWFLLLGVVIVCAAVLVAFRGRITWLIGRVREPFRRPLEEDPAFDGAVGGLAESPAALQSRFAFQWIWGPAVLFGLGVMFGFSAAYFAVDAILARFQVGWEQPVLGVANAVTGYVMFRIAAMKLSTWRLSVSVWRAATNRY